MKRVREQNLGIVLRQVAERGPRSRATLAVETGLNKSTVSSLVADLIEAGGACGPPPGEGAGEGGGAPPRGGAPAPGAVGLRAGGQRRLLARLGGGPGGG